MGKAKKKGKKGKKGKKKKKKKKKSKKPVELPRGFLLDIVISHLESVHINPYNIDAVDVEVGFRKDNLKITSSRLHVIDFVPDRSYVFEATSKTVGGILMTNPLTFTVNYQNRLVGTSVMKWPFEVINEIQQFRDTTFTHKARLVYEGKEDATSSLEAIIRLQPKCMELPEVLPSCLPDKCEAAQKTISPNDVMFLVADAPKVNACNDMPFYQPRRNETLDFAAYQMYHGGTLPKLPDLPNTFCNLGCCKVKHIAKEYGPGVFEHLHCNKEVEPIKKIETKYIQCEITSDVSSSTSLHSCSDLEANDSSDEEVGSCNQLDCGNNLYNSFDTSIWNTPESAFKARRCKICKVKLKYADPKAPCAICGMVPVTPMPSRKAKDFKRITVEEILDDYITKNPEKNKDCLDCKEQTEAEETVCIDEEPKPPDCPCLLKPCRCRCALTNKPCAYCRVRNTCEVADLRLLDPHKDKTKIEGPNMETTCAPPDVEPEEKRPYLITLLNELRSIYKIDEKADKTCKEKTDKYELVQQLKNMYRPKDPTSQSYNMTSTCCRDIKKICRQMQAEADDRAAKTKTKKTKRKLNKY